MNAEADHDHDGLIVLFGECTVCEAEKIMHPTLPEPSPAPGAQVMCVLCDQPVDPRDSRTMRQVVGWIRDRSQGGANGLRLRQELHRYAHADCVDAARRGHNPDQGNLLGADTVGG